MVLFQSLYSETTGISSRVKDFLMKNVSGCSAGVTAAGVHVRAADDGCAAARAGRVVARRAADLKRLRRCRVLQAAPPRLRDDVRRARLRRQREGREGGDNAAHREPDWQRRGAFLSVLFTDEMDNSSCRNSKNATSDDCSAFFF